MSSVASAPKTTPDKVVVTPKPTMAKAALRDNSLQKTLSNVVKTAGKQTYQKQGAMAATLGKDEGNFSRDVDAGRMTLAELAALGPDFLAAFASLSAEEFAKLSSPQQRMRLRVQEARAIIDEFDQYLDHTA